jgi:hypothetical protein
MARRALPAAGGSIDREALRALGARLSSLLAAGDATALDVAAEGAPLLAGAFTPEEDQVFKTSLRRFDFDEAAVQLRTLLQRHDCVPTS